MSTTNLSDIAQQKLQQIHQLVLQFQALENDLRDTFEEIETNHQSEVRKLRQEINQLKGVEESEMNTNNFFNAAQLKQNPLSVNGNSNGGISPISPRNSSNQQHQQHQQQHQPSQYLNNNSYQNHQSKHQLQTNQQQNQMQQQQQQRNHNGSVVQFNQPPPPIAPQQQNHWKGKTAIAYNKQSQQQQNGYAQQNGYHSKQSRSTGNGMVPGPPPQQNQYGQYGVKKAMPSNSKSLPPSPQKSINGSHGAHSMHSIGPNMNNNNNHNNNHNNKAMPDPPSKKDRPKNPVAGLMSKFTQNNKNEKYATLDGLGNGISERDFYKKYWIEAGKIGEGAFARVRKITRKSDKAVFALKMIKKKGKSAEDIAALQREILVLQKCDHSNIVRLADWCDTKKRIYMVVEFCDGGDVFERVVQYKKFSEKSAIHVVKEIASGIGHVHSLGYVHRDLKPDNLMYLTKAIDSKIKIIDFGLAGDVNINPCKTPCGTAHYAAPEVLSSQEYNQSADMWSLGVIIYTLLCGFPPFFDASNNMKNLYHLIKKGQYSFPSPFWDDITENAKDLISKLLIKDPMKRLTAEQVLKHQWVTNSNNAPDKDLGNQYVKQMSHWQSTRQATEFGLGQEAPPPPPPDQPINLYFNQNNQNNQNNGNNGNNGNNKEHD